MGKEELKKLLTDLDVDSETLLLKLINEKRLTEDRIRSIMHAQSPNFVTSLSEVRSGMFLTKEGYVSRNYIADEVIALVFGVFDNKIEALSVEGKEIPFGSPELFVNTDGLGGLDATRLIITTARSFGLNADAAEYCQNFTVSGLVKKGDAFLPAQEEIIEIHSYSYNIQVALQNNIFPTGLLWSSSMLQKDMSKTLVKAYALRFPEVVETMPDIPLYAHPAFFVPFRKP